MFPSSSNYFSTKRNTRNVFPSSSYAYSSFLVPREENGLGRYNSVHTFDHTHITRMCDHASLRALGKIARFVRALTTSWYSKLFMVGQVWLTWSRETWRTRWRERWGRGCSRTGRWWRCSRAAVRTGAPCTSCSRSSCPRYHSDGSDGKLSL